MRGFLIRKASAKPSGKLCVCHAVSLLLDGASEKVELICSCSNIQAHKNPALAANFPSQSRRSCLPVKGAAAAAAAPTCSSIAWSATRRPERHHQHMFKQLLIIPRCPLDREAAAGRRARKKESEFEVMGGSWPGICRPRGENV